MTLGSTEKPASGRRARAPIENPISAMFDLSQDVSSQGAYIKRWTSIAIISLGSMIFVIGILTLYLLGQNPCLSVCFLVPLIIFGIMTMLFLMRIRKYFRYIVNRYAGIKGIRDAGIEVSVPKGPTAAERFLEYLAIASPEFGKLKRFYPASISRNTVLRGHSKKTYRFACTVTRTFSFNTMFFGVKRGGYAIYIKKMKSLPTLKDVVELERTIQDISIVSKIVPYRVVIVVPRYHHYDGLSEDLYTYLVQKEIVIKCRGKPRVVPFQVVVEDGKFYDMVPFVPFIPGELP